MRLQKQLSRRVRGKEYPKWLVVIPPKVIEELGWKEGDELDPLIDEGELRVKRAQGRETE